MLFAYFGPETTLPLTSALGAVLGFALMFGHQITRLLKSSARRIGRAIGLGRRVPASYAGPHLFGQRLRLNGRDVGRRDGAAPRADCANQS